MTVVFVIAYLHITKKKTKNIYIFNYHVKNLKKKHFHLGISRFFEIFGLATLFFIYASHIECFRHFDFYGKNVFIQVIFMVLMYSKKT
jgi:hypothetical protein